MTVQELIDKLTDETYDNEKGFSIEMRDRDGNDYTITGYDWCNQKILVSKDE